MYSERKYKVNNPVFILVIMTIVINFYYIGTTV